VTTRPVATVGRAGVGNTGVGVSAGGVEVGATNVGVGWNGVIVRIGVGVRVGVGLGWYVTVGVGECKDCRLRSATKYAANWAAGRPRSSDGNLE
jgi:hypothetical protein